MNALLNGLFAKVVEGTAGIFTDSFSLVMVFISIFLMLVGFDLISGMLSNAGGGSSGSGDEECYHKEEYQVTKTRFVKRD